MLDSGNARKNSFGFVNNKHKKSELVAAVITTQSWSTNQYVSVCKISNPQNLMSIELFSTFIGVRVIRSRKKCCTLVIRYNITFDVFTRKLTSHNLNDVCHPKLISCNRNRVYYCKLVLHGPNRICYRKSMPAIQRQSFVHSLRENAENQTYNCILSACCNIPPLPFFTVVLLKLLQYRPSELRWATIAVDMQIDDVKAKSKLQQYFACYQLAYYLVAHY